MGKMLKKCCMLALAGGMVFGGGCLNFGGVWKVAGRGVAEGAGRNFGDGLMGAFVTRPITRSADGVNDFWQADAAFHVDHDNPHPADDDG